jgi:hypothetical protein
MQQWETWKTIRVGTGLRTALDFKRAMEAAGMKIGYYEIEREKFDATDASEFATYRIETEMELVVVTVSEIGFNQCATPAEVWARAEEIGLSLCPPEVGPQLRLQYLDQPNAEWLQIAMLPISCGKNPNSACLYKQTIFGLSRDEYSGFWLALKTLKVGDKDYFHPKDRLVFIKSPTEA